MILIHFARFCRNITTELQGDCIPTLCDIGMKLSFDWYPISVVCSISCDVCSVIMSNCRLLVKHQLVQLISPCYVGKGAVYVVI